MQKQINRKKEKEKKRDGELRKSTAQRRKREIARAVS